MIRRISTAVALALLVSSAAFAADVIRLTVDATDAPRDILHARLTVPVHAGPLTLYYPKWLPGEHGPTGPLVQMAGLRVSANGKTIPWTRDLREMYAVNVDVPSGVDSINVDLDYLDPSSGQFTGGGSMTPRLALISWNTVLVYPGGQSSDALRYEATLRLPSGWKYATSLTAASANGDEIRFEPVTLSALVDSPVLAAVNLKKVEIPSSSPYPHRIDIAADGETALQTPEDFAASYGRIVDEERALFGAEHFRHYDWLLTLSDAVAHFGLEHHQSSDNRVAEDTLGEEATRRALAGLLAHEYSHSWNGKYRRPAGLATPNFEVPMTGELLWVYEGLTTYLGDLLPYRAGLWTPEYYRDSVALSASSLSDRPGRAWRPLEDTAVEAQVLYGAPAGWSSYRRGVDFYEEGALLWLDADMTIRKATGNKRSLDDFMRRFYGGTDGDVAVKPYTFEDVVRTLNDVAPMDWSAFLRQRLRSTESAPLAGIATAGWKLVYNDTPNAAQEADESRFKNLNATTTLGFSVGDNGRISDVTPGSPAAKAGLIPGAQVVAVNGRRFTKELLRNAIRDSKSASGPMQVIFTNEDFFSVASIDYHGGLRYPHLERIASTPDWLAELGKPLAKKK